VIARLSPAELDSCAGELGAVLVDVVDGGNSVGFLLPLELSAATAWWRGLVPAVADGSVQMWAARTGEDLCGTVQLRLAAMPNGLHRAEVAKLMVAPRARGRGLGRELLATVERAAVESGVSLLILDTETGSAAESLYRSAGWTQVGTVPDYAADPRGELQPTTFFYKRVG
jgi:ribosomal protein S18 acetylase RimI-like enzyme